MAWRHMPMKGVIEAKYRNEWDGWRTKHVSSAYGVSLWKFIRADWLNFSKLLRNDVGVGTRVIFQKHVWCEILEACVVWGLYS